MGLVEVVGALAKLNLLIPLLKIKRPMMIFSFRVLSVFPEKNFCGPSWRQLHIIKTSGFNRSLKRHHQTRKILGSGEGSNQMRTGTESNSGSRKWGGWTREEAEVFTMARGNS